mmetsp:Transcript_23185/g.48555  ORF Transcript_23185/g.48555 Transcript_23185/m.48555 type:complete len:133 (-) Transcript_23185:555-953(-)
MQGTKSQHVDDFLETGLSFFRHAPKTAASEKIKAKEQSRSISEGSKSWMPTPLVPLNGLNELASGEKQPAQSTDGQVAAQTIVDCGILATPGLVGCIAVADSIATGKSLAQGLTDSFRIGPKPKESPYKPGW